RDADRVAAALVAGVPARVEQRAAAGTISRKEAGAPSGAAGRKWVVTLLHQALELDPSAAADEKDGTRKLRPTRAHVAPIALHEARVKLDASGQVQKGTLAASIDDGGFRGTRGTLDVDEHGNVTGALDVRIAVPNAFAKNVRVSYDAGGLHATV